MMVLELMMMGFRMLGMQFGKLGEMIKAMLKQAVRSQGEYL